MWQDGKAATLGAEGLGLGLEVLDAVRRSSSLSMRSASASFCASSRSLTWQPWHVGPRLLAAWCLAGLAVGVDESHDFVLERAAFGSCNKQEEPQPLWGVIGGGAPQLWLWTGDAVYAHGPGVAPLAEAVRAQRANGNYSAFAATVVVDGAWDDHDLGVNDAGGREATDERRAAYLALFGDARRSALGAARRGVFHSRAFGPPGRRVAVLSLDTRSFRDDYLHRLNVGSWCYGWPVIGRLAPLVAALLRLVAGCLDLARRLDFRGDVLGDDQWAWLERELEKERAAQFVVVVTSIQFATSNPAFESWAHFPRARRRLLRVLHRTNATGVVLLSGDVHHADLAAPPRKPGGAPYCGDVVELTSSGLTHSLATSRLTSWLFPPLVSLFAAHRPEADAYYARPNFGTLTFDWHAEGGPTMTVAARDEHNAEVLAADVRSCRFKRAAEEDAPRDAEPPRGDL